MATMIHRTVAIARHLLRRCPEAPDFDARTGRSEPDSTVTVPPGPKSPTSRGRLAADPQGRNGQPVALRPEPPSHALAQHTSGNRPSQVQARLRRLVGFRLAEPTRPGASSSSASL